MATQAEAVQRQIESARRELDRMAERIGKEQETDMLSQAQRTAILELSAKGVSKREIARVLRLSRLTVRKVLRSQLHQVPEIHRAEKAEPYRATDPGAFGPVQGESRASP